MIKLFKEVNNEIMIIDNQENIIDNIEDSMWIHLVDPEIEQVDRISEITGINHQMLVTALDEEETAHLDIDDDTTLIVLDIPIYEDEQYGTLPFAILYNEKYYITLCTKEANLINSMFQKFKKIEPHKHVRLSLQIMYRIASMYISSLKIIDAASREVERVLHSSMKNKELFDLMNLNKSLVYFSTSLNSNKIVLSKLERLSEYKKYEDDFDLMEDVEVENNQAIEMCSIYRDILAGMMDAFASIISNNLNIVMKALAVVTIILSIPTLVASIFGMNVDVPLSNSRIGFYVIIGFSLLLAILGSIALFMYTKKVKK